MATAILKILASIAAIIASWYLGKQAVKWIQWYRTARQKSEIEQARKDAQDANQRANADSDKLKEIDGR